MENVVKKVDLEAYMKGLSAKLNINCLAQPNASPAKPG